MVDSFPFPIFSGLLTPEHKQKIGPAIWEFLWCISKITKEIDEDGEKKGLVLGGKPIKYSEIAEDLGVSSSSVKRNMKRLEQYQYIEMKRAPYGEIIYVRNSKKFRKTKNDLSEQKREVKNDLSGQIKNDLSDRDSSKMTYPDRPKMDERQTENGLCNKDIKDIKPNDDNNDDFWANIDNMELTPEQQLEKEIEEYYQAKRGKHDWPATAKDRDWIQQAIKEGFTRDEMIAGITKAFLDAGEVNSFEYCLKVMRTQRKQREQWKAMKQQRRANQPPEKDLPKAVREGHKYKPLEEMTPEERAEHEEKVKQIQEKLKRLKEIQEAKKREVAP